MEGWDGEAQVMMVVLLEEEEDEKEQEQKKERWGWWGEDRVGPRESGGREGGERGVHSN